MSQTTAVIAKDSNNNLSNIQTDKQTNRQTDKQTNRQTDSYIIKQQRKK